MDQKKTTNPPTELYAFVIGSCAIEIGTYSLCFERCRANGMNPDNYVFKYRLIDNG